MLSTGHHVCLVCVVSATMIAATWVAVAENAINSVPSSRYSNPHSPGMVSKDGGVARSLDGEQQYHWIVTRRGQLANSVYDVGDPVELSHYIEFDVIIKQRRQRRKRKLSDDDVTRLVLNASTADRGMLTITSNSSE